MDVDQRGCWADSSCRSVLKQLGVIAYVTLFGVFDGACFAHHGNLDLLKIITGSLRPFSDAAREFDGAHIVNFFGLDDDGTSRPQMAKDESTPGMSWQPAPAPCALI